METLSIDLPQENAAVEYPNRYTAIPVNGEICPVTGLKHSKLYSMLSKGGEAYGKVRVANLKAQGTNRGKTIFHVGDMLRYLDGKAAQQRAIAEAV